MAGMIFQTPDLPKKYLEVIEKIGELRVQLAWATSDRLNRWRGQLARTTMARAVQGSNAIEGINVTLDDAVAAIDGGGSPPQGNEDLAALGGYWRAMTFVLGQAKDPHFRHNEQVLKGMHYMMLEHDLGALPGRWRPGGVHVTNTATKQVVYEAPDFEQIPALVGELVDELNNDDKKHPQIVRAAMAHLNLTMIHPFKDGNGRMARALQSLVLMREGIVAPEFSCIEEYIGDHSGAYYAVLGEVGQGRWNPVRDALPWIRFCLLAHHNQAMTLLRRIKESIQMWGALEEAVRARGLNPRVLPALADAAIGLRVNNPSYRRQAEIDNQSAKADLKNLMLAGFLQAHGERRGRYYVAAEPIKAIRDATRVKAQVGDPFEDDQPPPTSPPVQGALFGGGPR
jgi:Fic family protein